jgi:hypothetical protein
VSILLIDPSPELGAAIAELLLDEGDEVRVLTRGHTWDGRGVFVAVGDPMDADLVERACTNVRTVVLAFDRTKGQAPLVDAVLPPAHRAGVGRVVLCTPVVDRSVARMLEGSEHVVLVTGRRGFLPRRNVEAEKVATAVSAADDLAGEPKMVVDLTSEEGWKALGAHA